MLDATQKYAWLSLSFCLATGKQIFLMNAHFHLNIMWKRNAKEKMGSSCIVPCFNFQDQGILNATKSMLNEDTDKTWGWIKKYSQSYIWLTKLRYGFKIITERKFNVLLKIWKIKLMEFIKDLEGSNFSPYLNFITCLVLYYKSLPRENIHTVLCVCSFLFWPT